MSGNLGRRSNLPLSGLAGPSMMSLILLVLLVVGGYHSYLVCLDQREDCRRKELELRASEKQIRRVEVENRLLEKRQERLRTAAGVEEIAREKLGMVRQGEIAYVVQPGPPEASPAEPVVPPPPGSRLEPGWLEKVLGRLLF